MDRSLLAEVRRGAREGIGWVNRRRSLVALVRTTRELLPGDRRFGDPMSTTGSTLSHLVGRRAWTRQDGRLSLLAELMLSAVQLADWLQADVRGIASGEDQSILFVDLGGFSRWALDAREGDVASLLRHVDAIVTQAAQAHDGVIVKRLGDGLMAIFADCEQAVNAAFAAIAAVSEITVNAYRPSLRAGVHAGRPDRIGRDYVGVDVNIAARLCEAAPPDGVLVSGVVHERLHARLPAVPAPEIKLRGVPDGISIHLACPPSPTAR